MFIKRMHRLIVVEYNCVKMCNRKTVSAEVKSWGLSWKTGNHYAGRFLFLCQIQENEFSQTLPPVKDKHPDLI